jgi:hypothetical protein
VKHGWQSALQHPVTHSHTHALGTDLNRTPQGHRKRGAPGGMRSTRRHCGHMVWSAIPVTTGRAATPGRSGGACAGGAGGGPDPPSLAPWRIQGQGIGVYLRTEPSRGPMRRCTPLTS